MKFFRRKKKVEADQATPETTLDSERSAASAEHMAPEVSDVAAAPVEPPPQEPSEEPPQALPDGPAPVIVKQDATAEDKPGFSPDCAGVGAHQRQPGAGPW